MRTHYHPRLKGTVTVDDANRIRGISHLDEYREMKSSRGRSQRGREAAAAYIRDIAKRPTSRLKHCATLSSPCRTTTHVNRQWSIGLASKKFHSI